MTTTSKLLLEYHVCATGMKKGHVIEEALRHHLHALHELPADVIIRARLVVTRKSGDAILKQISSGKPTPALRRLMRDGD